MSVIVTLAFVLFLPLCFAVRIQQGSAAAI
jgi:hypothetical protein